MRVNPPMRCCRGDCGDKLDAFLERCFYVAVRWRCIAVYSRCCDHRCQACLCVVCDFSTFLPHAKPLLFIASCAPCMYTTVHICHTASQDFFPLNPLPFFSAPCPRAGPVRQPSVLPNPQHPTSRDGDQLQLRRSPLLSVHPANHLHRRRAIRLGACHDQVRLSGTGT